MRTIVYVGIFIGISSLIGFGIYTVFFWVPEANNSSIPQGHQYRLLLTETSTVKEK